MKFILAAATIFALIQPLSVRAQTERTLKQELCDVISIHGIDFSYLVGAKAKLKDSSKEINDVMLAISKDPASCMSLEEAFLKIGFLVPEQSVPLFVGMERTLEKYYEAGGPIVPVKPNSVVPAREVDPVDLLGSYYMGLAMVSARFNAPELIEPKFRADFIGNFVAKYHEGNPAFTEAMLRNRLTWAALYSGHKYSQTWIYKTLAPDRRTGEYYTYMKNSVAEIKIYGLEGWLLKWE